MLTSDCVAKIIEILGIDPIELEEVKKKHLQKLEEEFNAWASREVPNEFYYHLMPAVFAKLTLPREAQYNDDAAIEYVTKFVHERRHKIGWLHLSRREVITFYKDGRYKRQKEHFKTEAIILV